jgi:peptide/nickel transport system permease protein
MVSFLLRRAGVSLLVLVGLSLLAFGLVRLVEGDTVTALLGMNYTEQRAEALRAELGLDKPIVVQYGIWIARVLQGDLGETAAGVPVTRILGEALPVTLQLAGMALVFALMTGMPLGMLAAARPGKASDNVVSVVSLIGLSVPGFWLGTLLILVLAVWAGVLPTGRYVPISAGLGANLRHMLLPTVALGLAVAAVITRMTRSSMLEVMNQDYVRTARAKGLRPRTVMWKHVARNGVIPVLTIAGLQFGYLLGGSIVIENVFALRGIGAVVLEALGDREYPVIQAVLLLIGSVFVAVNLAVDVLTAWADPRLSLA